MLSGSRRTRTTDRPHYEEERAHYNAAFAKFDAVRNQYRARQCEDAEFLAAKKEFAAAQAALDEFFEVHDDDNR